MLLLERISKIHFPSPCIMYMCVLCFEHQKCVYEFSIQNILDRNLLTLSSSSSQEVALSVHNASLTGVNPIKRGGGIYAPPNGKSH